MRFFLSAVRFFLLPWGFFFCRDSCGPPCISYSPLTSTQKTNACMHACESRVNSSSSCEENREIWLPSAPHDWYWYASFPVTPDTGKGSFPTEILTIFENNVRDRKAQEKLFFFFKNTIPDIEKLSTLVKIHFQSKVRLIKYLREVWATCQNRKMDDFLTSRLVKIAHWMRFAIIHIMPLWNQPGNKPTVSSLSSRMFYLLLLQERRK